MLKQSQNLHKVGASEKQQHKQASKITAHIQMDTHTLTYTQQPLRRCCDWLHGGHFVADVSLWVCVCAGGSPRAQKIRIMFSTKNALTNWGHARVRSGTAQRLEVWASFFPFTLITFARGVQPPQPLQHTYALLLLSSVVVAVQVHFGKLLYLF